MKLTNNSTRNYVYDEIVLEAGKTLDVTDKKAIEVLLKQPDVVKHVDFDEVEELKAKLEKLEAIQVAPTLSRQEMFEIAHSKGLKPLGNISNKKLAELIK